jgi:hypothetical protein
LPSAKQTQPSFPSSSPSRQLPNLPPSAPRVSLTLQPPCTQTRPSPFNYFPLLLNLPPGAPPSSLQPRDLPCFNRPQIHGHHHQSQQRCPSSPHQTSLSQKLAAPLTRLPSSSQQKSCRPPGSLVVVFRTEPRTPLPFQLFTVALYPQHRSSPQPQPLLS